MPKSSFSFDVPDGGGGSAKEATELKVTLPLMDGQREVRCARKKKKKKQKLAAIYLKKKRSETGQQGSALESEL